MIPLWHFISSLILSLVLYPYFGFYSLLTLLLGWFIDVDHIIYYCFKFKRFNYKEAYKYFRDHKFHGKVINVFHTLEFYAIMLILSFYNIYAFIISLGLFLHTILDIIYFFYLGRLDLRYWALTGWIIDKFISRKS